MTNNVTGYVYILASKTVGTLYIGVTSDLVKRVSEHKNGIKGHFSSRYKVHNLVYYEAFDDIRDAIAREKQLKKWERAWKIQLIESFNPSWSDLFSKIVG